MLALKPRFHLPSSESHDHGGIALSKRGAAIMEPRPQCIKFLLFPGFSLLALSSFLQPFEKANALLGKQRFHWMFASQDGRPVACSSGFELPVTLAFDDIRPHGHPASRPDMTVLVAGDQVENCPSRELSALVRTCLRHGVRVIALGTATWLLAEMGALHGATCTLHWQKMAAFAESFDGPRVVDALFADDGGIVTCAGELAAFDLAVNLIAGTYGPRMAEEICSHAVTERPREASTPQNRAAWIARECASEKLAEAIRLMDKNLQEPIDLDEIASRLSVSRRQVERLFVNHLGISPHKYYVRLRLERARQLLVGTGMPIVEIAIASGFISASHFSKCFRQVFNTTPKEVRSSRMDSA